MSRAGNRDLLAASAAALALHAGVLAIGAQLSPRTAPQAPETRTPMEIVLVAAAPIAQPPDASAAPQRSRTAAVPALAAPPAPTVQTTVPALPAPAIDAAPASAERTSGATPAQPAAEPSPRLVRNTLAPARTHALAVDTPSVAAPVAVAALPDVPLPGDERTAPSPATGNERPRYPRIARERGYEGEVELRVHVLANGTTDRVTVMRSSGHDVLDRAAVRAAERWRFSPATERGRAVDQWVELPIQFNLSEGW